MGIYCRARKLALLGCLSSYLFVSCQTPPSTFTPETSLHISKVSPDFQAKLSATERRQLSKITAPPEGITAPPEGITAPPEGITAPPEGITAPPEGITAPPEGITAPPEGLTDPNGHMNTSHALLQLALANYHEVDANFYDADRLAQRRDVGAFQTQLLKTVTGTLENIVQPPPATPTPSSSPSDSSGSVVENIVDTSVSTVEHITEPVIDSPVVDTVTETVTDTVENTVNTVENTVETVTRTVEAVTQVNLTALLGQVPLGQLLSQLLPVPREELYRLQARDVSVHAGFVDTDTSVPVFALQVDYDGFERHVLRAEQGNERVLRLTENGSGFVRTATRQIQFTGDQQRVVTRSMTTLSGGGSIQVEEVRLLNGQGVVGQGQGSLVITQASGAQQRFVLKTTATATGFNTQVEAMEIRESLQGQATVIFGEHAEKAVDFDLMLEGLGG